MGENIVKICPIKKQINIKKRVCAYARVSTNSNEQRSSFESQMCYYKKYISKNNKWEYIGIYSDKGVSGTSIKKRTGFNTMIKDCEIGKIDLIITKSITRFARNTIDSIGTIRKLKVLGVVVYFERENIYTDDDKSEQMITILSLISQMESENISKNIRWSIQRQFQMGEYKVRIAPYGYKKNNRGELIIDRKKATIVRRIFEEYIGGNGCKEIIKKLNIENIQSPNSDKWNTANIMYIIKNPIYIGDLLLQKTYKLDIFSTNRLINNGERPKYLIQNNHSAIIDKNIFEIANNIYKNRRAIKTQDETNITANKYEFSGIVYCKECRAKMYRKARENNKSTISCTTRLDNVNNCCNRPMRETQMNLKFLDIYNYLHTNKKTLLDDYIKNLEKNCDLKNYEIIDNMESKIEDLDEQIHILIKNKTSENMKSAIFIQKHREIQFQKDILESEIKKLKISHKSYNIIIETEKIIKILQKYKNIIKYDKEIFKSIVSKLYIGDDKSITFELKNGICITNDKNGGINICQM